MVMEMDMNTISQIVLGLFLVLILFPFMYKEHLYRQIDGVHSILGEFHTHTHKVEFIPVKVDGQLVRAPKNHKVEWSDQHKQLYGEHSGYIIHYNKVNKTRWPNRPFIFKWLSIEVPICEWDEGNPEPIAHHDSVPVITNKYMLALADTAEIVAKARTGEAIKEQAEEFQRTMKDLAKKSGGSNKNLLIIGIAVILIAILALGAFVLLKFSSIGV